MELRGEGTGGGGGRAPEDVREAEANEALGLGAASGLQGSEEDSQVWKRLWSSSVAAQAVNQPNPKP